MTTRGPVRILLIEDDEDTACGLRALLSSRMQCVVEHTATTAAARGALRRSSFDVILADLSLPDGDGLPLIEELTAEHPGLGVLCLTGRDEALSAIRAIRAGAVDYLIKPVSGDRLLQAIDAVLARSAPQAGEAEPVPLGEAPSWRRAMALLERVAQSPRTTVLLTGEPGVGKEEAAVLLHRRSNRSARPFVAVNAACLSPTLIESELFGHEAGAFTGAVRQRRGLLEQADGGTLFLDEIGELPIELQPKLLRLLEDQTFRRVGGERTITVDVRLVGATNRRLDERVRAGSFRADLHERLRVFEIPLPPLRERPGDVELLARHFAASLSHKLGRRPEGISPEAMDALRNHAFPGNVRELRNIIERALVLTDGPIERRHLPPGLAPLGVTPETQVLHDDNLEATIREHILRVYERSGHNVTLTAQALSMSRLAVRKRLQSYGVRAKNSSPGR